MRTVPRADGRLALEVANVTQSVTLPADASVAVEGYWPLMLPERCPRRALVLGLGGGTFAALLARRCPGIAIVGIERNAAVLAVARRELGLDAVLGLEVVEADAFAWVEEHAASESGAYDLICVDLFEGGRLAPGTLARPFLRQLALLLRPDGTLTINLMHSARLFEQLHRVQSIFVLARQERTWGNVVLHLRASTARDVGSIVTPPAPARSSPADR